MVDLNTEGLEAEMLPVLVKTFPNAFFTPGRRSRLLRVGIFHELDAALPPEINRARLKLYLGIYTRQPSYLRELTPGVVRIGLNGSSTGRVSAKEAASAAARLQKLRVPSLGPHVLKAAAASCPASACSMSSAPQPVTAPPAGAAKPPRASNLAGLAEVLRRKKAAEAEPQKLGVVLKRRKASWRGAPHLSTGRILSASAAEG
jgi:sRNA-binding protein